VRAFVAIDLDEDIRIELTRLQNILRSSDSDVQWVEPSNIHITLKFLGDINSIQIEKAKESMSVIAKGFNPFGLSLSKIGAFPKLDFPRVIWVGIDKGREELISLNQRIEDVFEKSHFRTTVHKEDRSYEPHLTIGRVRSARGNKDGLKKVIMEHDFSPTAIMDANKITLYQSTLTSDGPIYTMLGEAEFK